MESETYGVFGNTCCVISAYSSKYKRIKKKTPNLLRNGVFNE